MSQHELYKILKSNPGKKFTSRSLMILLGGKVGLSNVMRSLRRLRSLDNIGSELKYGTYYYWYEEGRKNVKHTTFGKT